MYQTRIGSNMKTSFIKSIIHELSFSTEDLFSIWSDGSVDEGKKQIVSRAAQFHLSGRRLHFPGII